MEAFNQLSPRQKSIEVGRGLLVVPAALVAGIAAQTVSTVVIRAIDSLSEPGAAGSIHSWTVDILGYALPAFVFVIAGAWMAPRKRLLAAILLALGGGALSLMQHVVIQQLAGHQVGPTNYRHFGLQMAGFLAGAAAVAIRLGVSTPRRIDEGQGSSGA